MSTPDKSTPFRREPRYLVFKIKDLEHFATAEEVTLLDQLDQGMEARRGAVGKPPLVCVVVEQDWPEYEPTWKAIEARMSTPAIPPAPSEQKMAGGARKEHQIETAAPTEVPQEAAGEDGDFSNEPLTPRDLERMAEGKKRFLAASVAPTTDEAIARQSHLDVLFEARDTVQASLAETDISDERKSYRRDLLKRLNEALTDISKARLAERARSTPSPSQDTEAGQPDAALRIETKCKDCAGAGSLPVTEDDGDRSYQTGTQCLRCKGTGEDPEWRNDAIRAARNSPSSHQEEKGL